MAKILIANRGEIAVRVIRTARELGYRTVAVFSVADADAPHVALADEAVCIGGPSSSESYMRPDKLLDAAGKTGADALHPGYGFLAENAAFARMCSDAGLVFIGPPAGAIELMASKRLAKLAMLEAGVPCIPGYLAAEQDDATLIRKAREVGFPLMIKASAGGGGRGMRLVRDGSELETQLRSARTEALAAFGSDELILESAIAEPRHIEIQVFADSHGHVIHLGERDCSVQRRHQKLIEEAPSPFIDAAMRAKMGAAAVNAARACNYQSAGTVEFLVDRDGAFYFLEMNTRLQVEHPVTEIVTGQDLVAWQLLVAFGAPLPLSQDEISFTGHAIEVRVYAEDPRAGFLPQTGKILDWQVPVRSGIRIDDGIDIGQIVSPHYDPMLAKIVAAGEDRHTALRRLASAVRDTRLLGVNNNLHFLYETLCHPVFANGNATTAFVETQMCAYPGDGAATPPNATSARAALLCYLRCKAQCSGYPAGNWRSASADMCQFNFECQGVPVHVVVKAQADAFDIEVEGERFRLRPERGEESIGSGQIAVVEDGVRTCFGFAFDGDTLFVDAGAGHFAFIDVSARPAASAMRRGNGQVRASMDGAIVDVPVSVGERISRGQTVVVLEAMKMEHRIVAGIDGIVESLSASVGQQVQSRQQLASIVATGQDEA